MPASDEPFVPLAMWAAFSSVCRRTIPAAVKHFQISRSCLSSSLTLP
jgi:hypothetical protein